MKPPPHLAELAARRLEQLQRAGAGAPAPGAAGAGAAQSLPPLPPPATPSWPPASPHASRSLHRSAHPSRQPLRPPPHLQVALDLAALRAAGCLVPDQPRCEMAERLRRLKRPLLKAARAAAGPGLPCAGHIMVTSALRGEGKTFCAINLAMSIAMEVDTAVILVDADVVQPGVFGRLGIAARPPGLLDLLTGQLRALPQALVQTDVDKLLLMAAGTPDPRASELLASTAMDGLLARLAREYADHVLIFDAPPLLLTSEAGVLAAKVGQVLMVVEAGRTPRAAVQQAFASLAACPQVVSVLNRHDGPPDGARYGYGYGYGYGHGYGYGQGRGNRDGDGIGTGTNNGTGAGADTGTDTGTDNGTEGTAAGRGGAAA